MIEKYKYLHICGIYCLHGEWYNLSNINFTESENHDMKKIGMYKTFPSKEIEKSFVGVGFETLDRDMFKPEKCYAPFAASGVKHARCQTGWAKCEKEKGVYDFAWLDDIVDRLLDGGVAPWFNVGYGNPIYMPDAPNRTAVGCVPLLYGEDVVEAWKNYVRALARHFKGRVTHFEIWNEPDISHFWYPGKASASQYAKLISITKQVIESEIPDAKIGCCVGSFNFPYIEVLLKSYAPEKLDFFSYHIYTLAPEQNLREKIEHLRRILDRHGFTDTEIWNGEGGCPSWFPENHWMHPRAPGSERQQAACQLRRYFIEAHENVARSSFYQAADMWERPYEKAVEVLKKPAAQGVLNGLTYTPKMGYYTFGRLASFFAGDVEPLCEYIICGYKNDFENCHAAEHMSYRINGKLFYAYWVPSKIEGEMTPCEGFWIDIENRGEITEPVVIDMLTGEIFEVEPKTVNDSIISYKNLPYCDYPYVLCDKGAVKEHFIAE